MKGSLKIAPDAVRRTDWRSQQERREANWETCRNSAQTRWWPRCMLEMKLTGLSDGVSGGGFGLTLGGLKCQALDFIFVGSDGGIGVGFLL